MAIHPILMSAPMVRAILREIDAPGTGKTQTRRVMNPQPAEGYTFAGITPAGIACFDPPDPGGYEWRKRLFRPGDLLWVREAFSDLPRTAYALPKTVNPEDPDLAAYYRCDFERSGKVSWRPGIHMPKWASRLTLRVTDVRVQRLQDISEADARAEGVERLHGGWFPYGQTTFMTVMIDGREVPAHYFTSAKNSYRTLWDSINGPGAWARNDWVIATTFTPVAQNVSEVTP